MTNYNIGICIEKNIVEPFIFERAIANIQSLSKKYNLKIYTQETIAELNNCVHSCPSQKMIDDYKKGEIDCFIRGINDDLKFQSKFKETFGYKELLRLVFVQDNYNREFGIGPASAGEGEGVEKRLEFAIKVSNFLSYMKINPKIAVMSRCRKESVNHSEANEESWENSDYIVSELTKLGITASNIGIEIENAVGKFNYVLVENGLIGNQIYRTLMFLGNGRILGIPAFGINDLKYQYLYENNSRNEENYEPHINASIYYMENMEKRKQIT